MSRMPVLFIGHGSPLNAVVTNDYTRALAGLAQALPTPKAVLVVSAHWLSRGTRVLTAEAPRTIHDFRGFPPELYAVDYPAPGAPAIARRVEELVGAAPDASWGLDHGTWSVLRHMWPMADVPVLQLSLVLGATPRSLFAIGRKIGVLAARGVLLVGSGAITHNLEAIDPRVDARPVGWAREFDSWLANLLADAEHDELLQWRTKAPNARLAQPAGSHLDPLFVMAGAASLYDHGVGFPLRGFDHGTVSRRAVQFGR